MNKFLTTFLTLSFSLSASAFFAPVAVAAPAKCGDRAKLIEILKKNYSEVPVALGISQKNTEAFEVFASKKGTWTVIMTMASGKTCIMAAGHSWRDVPKQVADIKT